VFGVVSVGVGVVVAAGGVVVAVAVGVVIYDDVDVVRVVADTGVVVACVVYGDVGGAGVATSALLCVLVLYRLRVLVCLIM